MFNKGDEVTFQAPYTARNANGEFYNHRFDAGEVFVVTRVTTNKLLGKSDGWWYSFWIDKDKVVEPDPNAPKPRKPGVAPEGAIPTDHPDLAWLWEDAAKMADKLNLCGDYDRITQALDIPGRLKNYTSELVIGGVTFKATIEARSQKEANEKARSAANV